jgi:16S rRNA C967 or C1407 C5-methylase (RsmB/RsmF family)/NOL1/NOP2/fmu family ribosome biogenesis protein
MTVQFPGQFLNHISNCAGFNLDAFVLAHGAPTPVSIRYNPAKPAPVKSGTPVPWCEQAIYLPERPAFVFDPLFHAGVYYVQEASSMFTGYLFNTFTDKQASLNILDVCAAPGGKSTLIAGIMNAQSLLVSNEVIKSRVTILKENIVKWGNPNVVVSNNDPRDFINTSGFFDVIIVDAPCSGSGLFRKEPEAKEEWSLENVNHCSLRQQRILEDIFPALKPGGLLIYATCSYSYEEDEIVVATLLQNGYETLPQVAIPPAFGEIIYNESGYRFYPDKITGEGFFIAALRKKLNGGEQVNQSKKNFVPISAEEKNIVAAYVHQPENYFFFKYKEVIYCFPEILKPAISVLGGLHLIKSGTALGVIKNNELIPDHELAMSSIVSKNIQRLELNETDAITYLRKNTLQTDSNLKGWCLITHQHIPLGWAKMIPGRMNNYFPTELRIRK